MRYANIKYTAGGGDQDGGQQGNPNGNDEIIQLVRTREGRCRTRAKSIPQGGGTSTGVSKAILMVIILTRVRSREGRCRTRTKSILQGGGHEYGVRRAFKMATIVMKLVCAREWRCRTLRQVDCESGGPVSG